MDGLYIIVFTIIGLHVTTASEDWSYWGEHGPTSWEGICLKGERQSPIDIPSKDTVKVDMGPLKFVRYGFPYHGKITNNGHSVQIQLDGPPIHLEGGNLPTTYVLEQMHFHWPAEHTIDSNRDALELHFVHYDNQYDNVSMASQFEDGIAVVATLFEISDEDNPDIMPILKGTESVSKWVGKNTATLRSKVTPFLFLPKDHSTYYQYDGSLTTPGCQESVMWFVLSERLSISEQQLDVFKNVGTHNGKLMSNYRPTQAIGERKIYHHIEGYSSAASVSSSLLYTFLSISLVRLLQSSD